MVQPQFGTDGMRARAPEDLTVELAHRVGRAAARVLRPAQAVIGRDTRASGLALSDAVTAGLVEEGIHVLDVGVLPTPGIAFLGVHFDCPAFVISASHNPCTDNGIKVIGTGGTKLSVESELAIEEDLEGASTPPAATTLGSVRQVDALVSLYLDHVVGAVEPNALAGMTIVLDCAHGASSATAELIFRRLGARTIVIGAEPDGSNINDGVGSTHPELLAQLVVDHGADLGLAFDGDADRLVAVDQHGVVVPGDALLALFAIDLKERGALRHNTVVVTVMSNLGFHRAMKQAEISVRTVSVGDRNVVEAIDREGLTLGGEQSGHVIFRSVATTGDGVLTGVLLADLVKRSGKSLAELAGGTLTLVPQYLQAVTVAPGRVLSDNDLLANRIAEMEVALGDRGRILVRASGTEPVVRVMVEADDNSEALRLTEELVSLVESTMGSPG